MDPSSTPSLPAGLIEIPSSVTGQTTVYNPRELWRLYRNPGEKVMDALARHCADTGFVWPNVVGVRDRPDMATVH